mgnify:CR=1 FL=1
MKKKFVIRQALLMTSFVFGATLAHAQSFPERPITLVVPNPPGGLVDTSARLLSEPLTRVIGQPVIVDNKPGASGNVAYQYVAKAKPDGYTLLISYSGYHVGNPALMDKLPAKFAEAAANMPAGSDEKMAKRIQGIIDSMTPDERSKPELIKASRKRRIATGAGVQVQEVNRLLNQFEQTQKMMKQFSKGGMAKMMRSMKGMLPGMR